MKLAAEEKKTVVEHAPTDLSHQVETDETLHTKLGWWIVLAGFGAKSTEQFGSKHFLYAQALVLEGEGV